MCYKVARRLMPERAVRTLVITVLALRLDHLFGVVERSEPVLVEALLSQPAVEAFDECLVRWLTRMIFAASLLRCGKARRELYVARSATTRLLHPAVSRRYLLVQPLPADNALYAKASAPPMRIAAATCSPLLICW